MAALSRFTTLGGPKQGVERWELGQLMSRQAGYALIKAGEEPSDVKKIGVAKVSEPADTHVRDDGKYG